MPYKTPDSDEIEYVALTSAAEATEQQLQQRSPTGLPATKSLFALKDAALLAVVFVCFGVAVASVFSKRVAVYLGQKNQLIVVGFCLAAMALVCQRQVLFAYLLHIVYSGSASLQDVEAVLSNSVFITRSSYMCRGILLLLTAIPLGLAVAYKRFVGGSSSMEIASLAGLFGFESPPGYQKIGLGLTMITQVYLPFWLDPNIGSSYSFNLLVQSNDTSAVLDIPLPVHVNTLRQNLNEDEAIVLTATVNATVSQNVPIAPSLQQNSTYWSNMMSQYPPIDLFYGRYVFFANDHINHTTAYVSIWNQTNNETLESTVQQNIITRRKCRGTWRITSSNMTLLDGTILEPMDQARTNHNQTLIERNQMEIAYLFDRVVTEYDWQRYPRPRPINTVPALTATMIWSRLVDEHGISQEGSGGFEMDSHYTNPSTELITRLERTTLKRSGLLFAVLVVLPIMSILATTVKILLYKCPITDAFGLTSILAATDPDTLNVTRGAGLSGHLSRSVGVRFTVVQPAPGAAGQKIEIRLDEMGSSARVRRKQFYR